MVRFLVIAIIIISLAFVDKSFGYLELTLTPCSSINGNIMLNVQELSDFEVPGGFTNTGIAYDIQENTLWVGNNTNSKVVEMSKYGKYISDIDVPGSGGVQGVAYDISDNTLWVSKGVYIYNYSKSGTLLDTISPDINTLSAALSYIESNDALVVGVNNSNVVHIIRCSDGVETGSITFTDMSADSGVDGVVYDETTDTYWATKNGSVSIYHLNSDGSTISSHSNPDSLQAEGITIDPVLRILWYSADSEFHESIPEGNRVYPIYDLL